MYDWIIEADLYRLKKAASEATNPRERRELEALAQHKVAALSQRREAPGAGTSSNA
jgi:hypothetical protein